MNISEMIGDALTYPFKNIKALWCCPLIAKI